MTAFGDADAATAVQRRLVLEVQTALGLGLYRVDASDRMPPSIGGWVEGSSEQSAFYAGMVDWVDGVRSIDQVFADIEAAWEELRAAEN